MRTSIKAFVESLPRRGWFLEEGKLIRRKKEEYPDYFLCPIAFSYKKSGAPPRFGKIWNSDFKYMGLELGLTARQADLVADAADGAPFVLPYSKRVREMLLERFGLKGREGRESPHYESGSKA